MPLTDPIGDLLTRMRNAQHGRRTECRAQWSRIKQELCEVMKKNGYLADVRVEGEAPHQEIVVIFRTDRAPLTVSRVSRPGGRKYVGFDGIRHLLHGNSLAVLSTSQGLLTNREAREKKIGGELLCTVS